MKKALYILGSILLIIVLGLGGLIAWALYPHLDLKPLPPVLIDTNVTEGRAMLERSKMRVDYPELLKNFQSQRFSSFCGVASAVVVLNSLGFESNQINFFTPDASRIRSQLSVMFNGMSLTDLGNLLESHGVRASVHRANESTIERFRDVIRRNLSNSDDYILVNYDREILGQGKVGHISPLAAYDSTSDRVLIMDTASYKYPHTWVPVELLFSAMMTIDSSSGFTRGYIEVSK